MTTIERQVDIAASPEVVFDLVADLHDYGRWLPSAGDYEGTSEISPPPVAVGTTYVEHSRQGVRHGIVIALARPDVIAFRQPMTLRPRPGRHDRQHGVDVGRGDRHRCARHPHGRARHPQAAQARRARSSSGATRARASGCSAR